ncbi:hypothetical protein HDV02_004650 [Globomyces sp. JEL0801]|nr:hypothetical protein HDV02_004650 [Globomyces sp. JEL0801]
MNIVMFFCVLSRAANNNFDYIFLNILEETSSYFPENLNKKQSIVLIPKLLENGHWVLWIANFSKKEYTYIDSLIHSEDVKKMFEKYLYETFRIKQPKIILTEGVWKETDVVQSGPILLLNIAAQIGLGLHVSDCIDFAIKIDTA